MRLRFILAMAFVAVIAILSVVIFFRVDAASQLENYLFRGGMYGMSGLVDTLENYFQVNGSWQGADEILSSVHALGMPGSSGQGFRRGQGIPAGMGAGMLQLELVTTDGIVIYDSNNESIGAQISESELDRSIVLRDAGSETVGYLLIAGGGALQAGNQELVIDLLNAAAISAGLVAIVLGLIVALVLASGMIQPVRKLTRAAQTMASGDLSQRVEVKGHDEIAVLGKSFNAMAASLEKSERQRRAMTADVAHELRTPLAVQRAQVEAMLDGVYPQDEGNLLKVLEQNEMLSRLVEDLRTLALADSGELKLDKIQLDLVELGNRLIDRFLPVAGDRCLETKSSEGKVLIEADPIRIEQIMNNLFSNAIRHTPEDGEISVRISINGDNAVVEVRDSGEGIEPESLEKIFNRFYRAGPSRSREEGGTGLGLAIARQLALAHGGNLNAANHPQGGAVFTLSLPVLSLQE